MTTRLGLALLLLLASPALAQGPEVLVDAWSVKWASGRKAAWIHERIDSPAAGQLVFVARTWTPLDEGALATREERVETDGAGKVLRYALTQRTPWGEVTARAEPAEGGLTYRVQLRGAAPREGKIEGDVQSTTVVMHLMLAGRQPPAKRALRTLDLPGPGTSEASLEVRREGEGWRVDRKDQVDWFDAKGRFLRSELPERAAEMWLPAPSEAAARDLTAAAPADAPKALDVVEGPGLQLRRPAGEGWSLARSEKRGLAMVGLEHASGLGLFVMGLPMRLPQEEKALLAMAEQLRGGMNSSAKKRGEGPELGAPAMSSWRERRAVRYAIGGTMDMETGVGEAFLLDLDGTTVLIMTAGPADLAKATEAALATALAALELAPKKAEAAWERVQLDGASVELPVGWKAKADAGERTTAMGASRVKVTRGPVPAGLDMSQAQRAWVAKNEQNPALDEFQTTRDEDLQLDGRTVHVAEWTARMKPRNGAEARMRSCSCLSLQDGTYVEVVIVAFDMDFDLPSVDRVLASVRWSEAR